MPTKLRLAGAKSERHGRCCLSLLLVLWLAACATSTTQIGPRPGCDRNGDYEQRKAC